MSKRNTVPPEEETRQKRAEHVDEPKPHAGPHGAEHAHAQNADEKDRIGVVGKAEEPLRLLPAERAGGVQLRRRPGPHRVAARKTQHQCRAPRAAHTKKRLHEPRQPGGEGLAEAQLQKQRGHHQKRKEGRDHGRGAKLQRLQCGGADGLRIHQKPDQNTQDQKAKGLPPDLHTHHPWISMPGREDPCKASGTSQAHRVGCEVNEYGTEPKGARRCAGERGGTL